MAKSAGWKNDEKFAFVSENDEWPMATDISIYEGRHRGIPYWCPSIIRVESQEQMFCL